MEADSELALITLAKRNEARMRRGLQLMTEDPREAALALCGILATVGLTTPVPSGQEMDLHHSLYWVEWMRLFRNEVTVWETPFAGGQWQAEAIVDLVDSAASADQNGTIQALTEYKAKDPTTVEKLHRALSGVRLVTTHPASEVDVDGRFKQFIDAYKDLFENGTLLQHLADLVLIAEGRGHHPQVFRDLDLRVDRQKIHPGGRPMSKGLALRWLKANASSKFVRVLESAYVDDFRNMGAHNDYTVDVTAREYRSDERGRVPFDEVVDSLHCLEVLQKGLQIYGNLKLFRSSHTYSVSDFGYLDWFFVEDVQELVLVQHAANFEGTCPTEIGFAAGPLPGFRRPVGSANRLNLVLNRHQLPQYDLGVLASPESVALLETLAASPTVAVRVLAAVPVLVAFQNIQAEAVDVQGERMLVVDSTGGTARVDLRMASTALSKLKACTLT